MTEDFMIHRFKTQWCPIQTPHDWESCTYAHTYRDWRRVPAVGYSSWPCKRWSRSTAEDSSAELTYAQRCFWGVGCPWAHGPKEQLYHPHFYKTQGRCREGRCRRGAFCAFSHDESDIRRPEQPRERDSRWEFKLPLPEAAMEVLRLHQPSYANPPAYHALRERGRGDSTTDGTRPTVEKRGFGSSPARGLAVPYGAQQLEPYWPHAEEPKAAYHVFVLFPAPCGPPLALALGPKDMISYHHALLSTQVQAHAITDPVSAQGEDGPISDDPHSLGSGSSSTSGTREMDAGCDSSSGAARPAAC